MKVPISEADREVLDWMVATVEGAYTPSVDTDIDGTKRINYGGMYPEWSTDWAQGGPIIEREGINVNKSFDGWWASYKPSVHEYGGTTSLIAAMRCYVASKLGDEVDVPEELCVRCCCGCTEPPVKSIDHPDVWPSCPQCGMV